VSSPQPKKNIALGKMSHNTVFMTEQENAESTNPQPQSNKLLILVRHAKSSWENLRLNDFDRPLNSRGLRDAPEMGKRLVAKYSPPDHFVSSPAVRAWATAELIANAWNFPSDKLLQVPDAYEASASTLLGIVGEFPPNATSAALVAHNPSITILVNFLAGMEIANVPTCGVAVIRFSVKNWQEIEGGVGELVEYDFPKNHPANRP
jgi:phosphohistidine phosphatase